MIDPKTVFILLAIASGAIAWQAYWLRRDMDEQRRRANVERRFLLELTACIQQIREKL